MPALVTYEDYYQMPDDGNRYEVIDGELVMCPSPITRHQVITGNLFLILGTWSRSSKIGKVLISPLDVVLDDIQVVQPDILFIADKNLDIIQEKNIWGAPDLAIEVLSEGNRRHDEIVKKRLYKTYGVTEYWIVDPVLESVKIYKRQQDTFVKIDVLEREAGDNLRSDLLPGFEALLDDIFAS